MEQFSFSFQQSARHELPEHIQTLIEKAGIAAGRAYAPYSNFKVGAAVLLENGTIITGANHENASYPAGICAERAVLANINPLIAEQKIAAIAVVNSGAEGAIDPLSPCGICRQVIVEQQLAQQAPIALYMCNAGGAVIFVNDATSLLPFYFSSKSLDSQIS